MRPIVIRIFALLALATPACTFGTYARPNQRALEALPPSDDAPWDGYGLVWVQDAMDGVRH